MLEHDDQLHILRNVRESDSLLIRVARCRLDASISNQACHYDASDASLFELVTTPKALIVITGGSGFIGNHTVHAFLSAEYRLRLVCRNQATAECMLRIHHTFEASIETVIVPDITTPGAFDDTVKEVDGVVHMASPFTTQVTDNERDLLKPALSGTVGILRSIAAHAPKVKRVVVTSSFAAVNDFSKRLRPGHEYVESQWNPITYDEAKNGNAGLAYG